MSKKLSFFALFFSITSLFADASDVETASQVKNESPTVSTFESFTGKIKGKKVRLRLSPSLDSSVLREAHTGEVLAIVGESNGFYAIRAPKDMKGYVFRTHILDNIVEGDRVNIRQSPDLEANVLGQLKKGEEIIGVPAQENNKWLEIVLPGHMNFYIAKEYVEKIGDLNLATQVEAKRNEALHKLNAHFCFAETELRKPFEEVEVSGIFDRFLGYANEFSDFSDLVEKAKEAHKIIEEAYLQKKIAFLESKVDRGVASLDSPEFKRLSSELRSNLPVPLHRADAKESGQSAALATGTYAGITDKMAAWQATEEAIYHLWAAAHEGKSIEDFYLEEKENAMVLTGIIESYDRPIKNRPGDYLLRLDNLPTAFLYSTKVNLESLVGKRATLVSIPRPNNHFAFPAYFVLSAD